MAILTIGGVRPPRRAAVEIRHLRLFIAVAETGSIHAGARRMMIAQPALSHALRKLEQEVRAELFTRSHRGVDLTDAGMVLLEHAQAIINRMDEAAVAVRAVSRSSRGPLRVGLVEGLVSAADLTVPILEAFRRRHPQIEMEVVELSSIEQFEAVAERAVDVAVVRPPCVDPRLRLAPLFGEPRVLCCAARHPVAGSAAMPVTAVLDETMIELVETPHPWRGFWALNDVRGGPPRRTRTFRATSLAELHSALLDEPDDLPAVMATAASGWRNVLADPRLRAVELLDAPPSIVAIGYHRDGTRASVPAFIECAREVTEQLIDLVPGASVLSLDAGAE
jgi:DNA-binding transcriptional LysR family regulator